MVIPSGKIEYLTNEQIDKIKWDSCIKNAPNGLIYGYSFYLDHLAPNWDGLVLNNYEAVMPLPWKKKYGIKYVYQPYFTAQGGIFSTVNLAPEQVEEFIKVIPASFQYISIHSNEFVAFPESQSYRLQQHTNYVLPLNGSYKSLYDNYSNDAKKNLRRAEKFMLQIQAGNDPGLVIELFRQQYGQLNKKIGTDGYARLEKLINYLLERKMCLLYEVREGVEVVAAAAFLNDNKRLYYILGAPTQKGRDCKAIHWLIDHVIKQHADSTLQLDFEGSDIPSVADFYHKFGPQKKKYQLVVCNRLPFFLRWFRR